MSTVEIQQFVYDEKPKSEDPGFDYDPVDFDYRAIEQKRERPEPEINESQHTLVIIKPSAFVYFGQIKRRIKQEGFTIVKVVPLVLPVKSSERRITSFFSFIANVRAFNARASVRGVPRALREIVAAQLGDKNVTRSVVHFVLGEEQRRPRSQGSPGSAQRRIGQTNFAILSQGDLRSQRGQIFERTPRK